MGAASAPERAQCRVALVGGRRVQVLVEDQVVFFFAAVAQDDGVDAAADVGVDGAFVAGGEGVEHGLCGGDDFRVAC